MGKSISPARIKSLIELYLIWAEKQERLILRDGIPLSPSQIRDARTIGVSHPDRVRLFRISTMPSPVHRSFLAVVGRRRLIPPETEALTLGYGIYIHDQHWGERSILAHELAHVSQVEKLGGLRPFYEKYMNEIFTFGYPNGPMEKEAMRVERNFTFKRAKRFT